MIAQTSAPTDRKLKIAMAAFAHPDAPTGYGVIGVKLHEYLQQAGAQVLPGCDFGWDCIVAVSLPAAWVFEGGRHRPDVVWHTMYEVSPLCPAWVEPLNRCGLVWVPAAWNKTLFQEAGVTAPIMVAGYGIDPTVYYPVDRAGRDGPYTFVIFGSALIGRKNVLRGIEAFIKADLPPAEARLIVKVAAGMSGPIVKDAHGAPYPNIEVIAEDWRYASQVADLLRQADCGISLSAGEGFGLQPLESMACGLPVILHHNTGVLDYATPANTLPVYPVGQERSPEYEKRFQGVYWQAVPDLTATVEHIRWAFHNRDAARRIGEQAAREVHANWTWAQAGQRALRQLEAHYGIVRP